MNRIDQLTRMLGVSHPLVQAPMAGVSTPALAAAVSNAGGLGSLGIGASTAEEARALISATRALTSRPFNVNLFCHAPATADAAREAAWLAHLAPLFAEFGAAPPATLRPGYRSALEDEAMLQMLLEERPAVVSFHFGLPPEGWIAALRGAGIVTLATATTLKEAILVEQAGIDAVVAQGMEAGGHRGTFNSGKNDDSELGTFILVRLLALRTRLPVLAAGGIMDGAGIAAALALGAAGVQMGTAFVPCSESGAGPAYRAALAGAGAQHTRITAAVSGRPARGLLNRQHTDVDTPTAPPLPDYPIAYDAAKALAAAAVARGVHDFSAQWAGQGAPLARALPAAQLVELLLEEWRAAAQQGLPH
jgi:nitronate monooxygenase